MAVALLVAGVQGGDVNLGYHRGRAVRSDGDCAAEGFEPAPHLAHHQVANRELDRRVDGVDCPRANTEWSGCNCHCRCHCLPFLCMSAGQSDPSQYSIGPGPLYSVCFQFFSCSLELASAETDTSSETLKCRLASRGSRPRSTDSEVSAVRSCSASRPPSLRPARARQQPGLAMCSRRPQFRTNRAVCVILNACTIFRQTSPCLGLRAGVAGSAATLWGRRCSDDAVHVNTWSTARH